MYVQASVPDDTGDLMGFIVRRLTYQLDTIKPDQRCPSGHLSQRHRAEDPRVHKELDFTVHQSLPPS
jgi:hypothetical protein